jgi:hypothetical protein
MDSNNNILKQEDIKTIDLLVMKTLFIKQDIDPSNLSQILSGHNG